MVLTVREYLSKAFSCPYCQVSGLADAEHFVPPPTEPGVTTHADSSVPPLTADSPIYEQRKFECPRCHKIMILTPEEYASHTYACPYCPEIERRMMIEARKAARVRERKWKAQRAKDRERRQKEKRELELARLRQAARPRRPRPGATEDEELRFQLAAIRQRQQDKLIGQRRGQGSAKKSTKRIRRSINPGNDPEYRKRFKPI